MSQENVNLVKGLFGAAERMDKQALLDALPGVIAEVCDPDIEWVEPGRVDARTYRGHAGVLESWTRWLDQWEEYQLVAERFIDCGDEVLVAFSERGRGASSGAEVAARNFMVITVRDGRIVRYREFYDEAAAYEAAGLNPADRSS
jgi:ketosteroid isomerase-like protein